MSKYTSKIEMPFKGLWFLVTGSGREGRVGANIACHMAGLGANVYLHYRSDLSEAERVNKDVLKAGKKHGVKVKLVSGDLSKESDVSLLFGDISPDVVIHNAAVFEPVSMPKNPILFERLNAEAKAFDRNLSANAKAVVLVTEAALHRMRGDGKTGTIVFVGDAFIHGGGVYPRGLVAYTISKAHISAIVRQYAVLEGKAGFRFFAILNGPIEPPPTASAEAIGKIRDEINLPKVNLKPWIGGDAVAKAISLILQAGAVNGACITVDGGRAWRVTEEH